MTLLSGYPAAAGIESIDLVTYPCSAGGRGQRMAAAAGRYFTEYGARVTALRGTCPERAVELIRKRLSGPRRPDAVVCAGGDDLISIVLQAIAGTGTPLGVLPTGPGDDLAIELGIPRDNPRAAADIVLAGNVREIDLGIVEPTLPGRTIEPTWFATYIHTDLDAPPSRTRRRPGISRQLSLRELTNRTAHPFRIELSRCRADPVPQVIDTEALLVVVGNTRTADGKPVCPNAALADGLLDITVIGAVNPLEAVQLRTQLAAGRRISHRAVTYHRAAALSIHCAGAGAVANGAPLGRLPLTVRAVASTQPVLAP